MIDITTLKESDKGRSVRYTAFEVLEYGRITSWNANFIFVRYYEKHVHGKIIPRSGETSEATDPRDLEFA